MAITADDRPMRIAVVVHDLQEIEVVGLEVPDVSLDGFGPEPRRAEVVPERKRRPIGSFACQHGMDACYFVHGFVVS